MNKRKDIDRNSDCYIEIIESDEYSIISSHESLEERQNNIKKKYKKSKKSKDYEHSDNETEYVEKNKHKHTKKHKKDSQRHESEHVESSESHRHHRKHRHHSDNNEGRSSRHHKHKNDIDRRDKRHRKRRRERDAEDDVNKDIKKEIKIEHVSNRWESEENNAQTRIKPEPVSEVEETAENQQSKANIQTDNNTRSSNDRRNENSMNNTSNRRRTETSRSRSSHNRRVEDTRNNAPSNAVELTEVKEEAAAPQREEKDKENSEESKDKVNFGLSGKLTEDSNTYNGVVIKYSQPPEARKPKRRWRWYIFKGDQELPFLPLHRQSAYLIGRERKIADIPTDHPSCSKQHAVFQYRLVSYDRNDGSVGRTVKPYILDLESANGTYVNNRRIDPRRYVELIERDVVKFGFSSREYVLLHEASKDSEVEEEAENELSPISLLRNH